MTKPYRSPLGWHRPTLAGAPSNFSDRPIEVQVSIPNEDPDTEDDLTLNFAFTTEGVIFDLFVSDGEPVATFGQMYDEFANTLVDLDPMTADERCPVCGQPDNCGDCTHDPLTEAEAVLLGVEHRPADSPIEKVAALSADLREHAEEWGWTEGSTRPEVDISVRLLDAIDALLSEMGR